MVQIEAQIKTVTFRNHENGYSVLKVIHSKTQELITVVGNLPLLEVGEHVALQGEWKQHPRFGPQFQTHHVQPIIPSEGENLVQYLSSGLFSGIGPVTAQKIVDRFGDKTLEVLDQRPQQLAEIPGLKGKRLQKFKEAWVEMRESRETLLFLYEHEITGSIALRIWKQYRGSTIQIIQENPYILCDEIWGIGFTRADDIGLKLGLARDGWKRLRAGLIYTLQKAAQFGHVYLPRQVLLEQAIEILRVGQDDETVARLVYSLDELIQEQELLNQHEGIWLPPLYYAEEGIATWIRNHLERTSADASEFNAHQALKNFEQKQKITYSPEQFEGICQAMKSQVYVITGGPGTGKTTTLQGILSLIQEQKQSVLLAAPTGRAARRMSELTGQTAQTLHRLLEINPSTRKFERNQEHPLESDWIVVDEFSMVDTWMGYALVQALGPTTRLLIIGDQDQLPSIGPGSLLKELLACGQVPNMRLQTIFRQSSRSDIAQNAQRVNQGRHPNLVDGSHFHFLPANNADEAVQFLDEIVLQEAPRKIPGLDRSNLQVLTPMHRGALGTFALNQHLQAILNPQGKKFKLGGIEWRLGDRVMQLKNDYDHNIFNGDVGLIHHVHTEESELQILFDERLVSLPAENLDSLGLAYACTVHKSQGSEYEAVVILLDGSAWNMLQRNLLYTAITRARGHVWIIATPGALDQAIRTQRQNKRFTRLSLSIGAGAEFMSWLEE